MNKLAISDEMILRAFKRVVIVGDTHLNRQVKEAIHQLSDDIEFTDDFMYFNYGMTNDASRQVLGTLIEFLNDIEEDYYSLEYIADLLRKRQ